MFIPRIPAFAPTARKIKSQVPNTTPDMKAAMIKLVAAQKAAEEALKDQAAADRDDDYDRGREANRRYLQARIEAKVAGAELEDAVKARDEAGIPEWIIEYED